MNIEETKKITLSLIDTFNEAGHVALSLREAGLKKETKSEQNLFRISREKTWI